MRLEESADLKPGANQAVVKIRAAGVNPVDAYIRTGTYPESRRCRIRQVPTAPAKSNRSAAASNAFKRGDRVYIAGFGANAGGAGTYAEYALCAADQLYRLPARASFAQGAALGVPYATAYQALFHRAQARPAETVLIHGATGGVGIAAVELAHARGLRVVGTAGPTKG